MLWEVWKGNLLFNSLTSALPKKCPYSEFFAPYFPAFGLNTEMLHKYPYSVQMCENADQKTPKTDNFYAVQGFDLMLN